jgi:hypothetical protein
MSLFTIHVVSIWLWQNNGCKKVFFILSWSNRKFPWSDSDPRRYGESGQKTATLTPH